MGNPESAADANTEILGENQADQREIRAAGMTSIPMPQKIRLAIVALMVASIGSFYLLTFRQGHAWGDDFAMYIQEAKDIASGVSYTHSNYIYNPQNADVGPRTYPPIYPLLLSPIYTFFGLNLTAMKVENTLFFLALLLIFYLLVKEELNIPWTLTVIATVGFSPPLWSFKEQVVSEVPFTFFVCLCLFWAKRVFEENSNLPRIRDAVLMALFIYLAYGTRTIGAILLPALLCFEVAKSRKFPWFSALVTILFLVPWSLQSWISSNESSYFAIFLRQPTNARILISNLENHIRELSEFWENGYSKFARLILFFAFSGVAGIGYVTRFRGRKASIVEFYVLLYLLAILVWPFASGLRFLIPVMPFYVFYGCLGLTLLERLNAAKLRERILIAFLLCTGLSYVGQYIKADFGPLPEGIGKPETQEFFQYVRERSDLHAIFIFRKPKALGLFGERHSSVYPAAATDQQTWEYIEKIHASHLVECTIDEAYWHVFIARNRTRLTEAYANPDFRVYRVVENN